MRFTIDYKTAALLIVDMINGFVEKGSVSEISKAREIIPKIKLLIDASHKLGIPVVYANHAFRSDGLDAGLMFDFFPKLKDGALNEGSRGTEVYADLAPSKHDIIVKKFRYSAFYNTELDNILRKMGKDTLIICGTVTEVCCESTARDAFFRDYKVLFPSDANASGSDVLHEASLHVIAKDFGEVLTTSDLLDRFLHS